MGTAIRLVGTGGLAADRSQKFAMQTWVLTTAPGLSFITLTPLRYSTVRKASTSLEGEVAYEFYEYDRRVVKASFSTHRIGDDPLF